MTKRRGPPHDLASIEPDADGRGRRAILPFLGLALLIRSINYVQVFRNDGLRLIGPDAYYHVRRIVEGMRTFPFLPSFDPYLSYPEGALCPYEPGFDFVLAALSRAATGVFGLRESSIPAFCALLMPLIGLLILPIYGRMALALGGPRAQWIAWLFLALLPGVFFPSQIGQVDHHVLEPLWFGVVMLMSIGVIERSGRTREAAGLGFVLFLGLMAWRGILVPAGLAAGSIVLSWGMRAGTDIPRGEMRALRASAIAFGSAGLLALFIHWQGASADRWTWFMLSRLQPTMVLSFGLGLGILAFAQESIRRAFSGAGAGHRLARLGLAGLFLGAPMAFFSLVSPHIAHNTAAGLGFLSRHETFVMAVGEQRPLLLDDDGHWTLLYLLYFFGAYAFVWPWAAVAALRHHRPGGDASAPAASTPFLPVLLLFSVATLGFAFLQRRYAAWGAPFFAVWLAAGVAAPRSRSRWTAVGMRRLGAMAFALLGLPTLAFVAVLPFAEIDDGARLDAMRWLRAHTPETSGFSLSPVRGASRSAALAPDSARPGPRPEYAVIAAWDEGHHVIELAHRPNIANPFGLEWFRPGLERVARFWLSPPRDAASLMDRFGARYVLVGFRLGLLRNEARFIDRDPDLYAVWGASGWEPGPRWRSTTAARLFLNDGLQYGKDCPVPGLRLIWEGGAASPGEPATRWIKPGEPTRKIFERIPGATLGGTSAPFATIRLQAPMRSPSGRTLSWQCTLKADSRGLWSFSIAYPTDCPPDAACLNEPLTIRIGGKEKHIEISAEAIQSGAHIRLPLESRTGKSAILPQ